MESATGALKNNLRNKSYGNTFFFLQGKIRSWSHVSLITNLKNFWQSVQKSGQEGKQEKKTRMAAAKLFSLNANTIN